MKDIENQPSSPEDLSQQPSSLGDDAFLDDYFSDLLNTNIALPKKILNSPHAKSKKTAPKKIASTKNKIPAIKAVDRTTLTKELPVKPSLKKQDQPVMPAQPKVEIQKVKQVTQATGLPTPSYDNIDKSSQKEALQQLLNRSLENVSNNAVKTTSLNSDHKNLAPKLSVPQKAPTIKASHEARKDSAKKTIEQTDRKAHHGDASPSVRHEASIPKPQSVTHLEPSWGQSDFEVLLFNVAGLTLAVPLVSLGQIYPLNNDITPIFGKSKWYMGIKTTPLGKIHVVNTAMFVMPEKYQQAHAENVKYVVTIDGFPWGLAVDAIDQPRTISPSQVKWRTQRSKRVWLAGTIKSAMCGLIDVHEMATMLMSEQKK